MGYYVTRGILFAIALVIIVQLFFSLGPVNFVLLAVGIELTILFLKSR
jgi:hypothetical protein